MARAKGAREARSAEAGAKGAREARSAARRAKGATADVAHEAADHARGDAAATGT
ncbi:hypothetical protein SAMN04490356_1227 [Streptomyces melanosporofaciens]|uniref:Uncharacterized protein n=1 Tax=Streptomyces melanosporofaciens TaxID=67327 RepID=A0A1H4LBG9_STRMJ|nr:hypothetical protein SAMN04490356_1227 [Streptomyces melanosporofaciens]